MEILFQPTQIGQNVIGIDEMVKCTIMDSDSQIRKDLYSNIVLAGGTTKVGGIRKRLEEHIQLLAETDMKMKILEFPDAELLTWKGGITTAHGASFEKLVIKKEDYDNIGKDIVTRKCL